MIAAIAAAGKHPQGRPGSRPVPSVARLTRGRGVTDMAAPADQAATRTLARLGFERTGAAAGWLGRLGAWPPDGDGRALLDELAASAKPDLAARVLADLVDAHPEPAALAARLRAEPGL